MLSIQSYALLSSDADPREGINFTVIPHDGFWWWDNPEITNIADASPPDEWKFIIRVPDCVTGGMVEVVKE